MKNTSPRLSDHNLQDLPQQVTIPTYDRQKLKTGIVHLGIGAFHRAHQAVYTDSILQQGSTEWGITGVSLRSPDTRDALFPQNGLYALAIRDGDSETIRVIGSIINILVAPENPDAVLQIMSHADTRIVSLTITEKGYCREPATGKLDEKNPDIMHDLARPSQPRTAAGFIVEALRLRYKAGLPPFTLLSCDNLPANGETLKQVIVRLAELTDPEFARYIEDNVAFPSTMVDRIVPATTDRDKAKISAALGAHDQWPVATEPFTQWVIEDAFPSGRPQWETAGVTFVPDVDAYELMKLRLLNGSHSTLAYLGYLAGYQTVAEVMAATGFRSFIRAMMDQEITPSLPELQGFDLTAYKNELITRFENKALHHRTWQIAMDGSQKIPQRLLNTIQFCLETGRPFNRLALGIAGWMRYVSGKDDNGTGIDVRDPLADRLRQATSDKHDAESIMNSLLEFREIFSPSLAQNSIFRSELQCALHKLLHDGAANIVAHYAEHKH